MYSFRWRLLKKYKWGGTCVSIEKAEHKCSKELGVGDRWWHVPNNHHWLVKFKIKSMINQFSSSELYNKDRIIAHQYFWFVESLKTQFFAQKYVRRRLEGPCEEIISWTNPDIFIRRKLWVLPLGELLLDEGCTPYPNSLCLKKLLR